MKVFVYGTLKQGHGNHRVLGDSPLLTTAKTSANYTMFNTGGFPAVIPEGTTTIQGEVYEVDETTFPRLDRLEGYPRMYDREVITVTDDEGQQHDAWIYLWQYDHSRLPVIEKGEW